MSNLDLGFDQIVSAVRTGKEYIFNRLTVICIQRLFINKEGAEKE